MVSLSFSSQTIQKKFPISHFQFSKFQNSRWLEILSKLSLFELDSKVSLTRFEPLDAAQQLLLVITINFVKYQIAIIYRKLWHNTSLGADGGDCGDVEWWWEEQEEGRGEQQWQLRRRIWSQYCHCYHHCRHQNAEYNNMLDWLGPGPGAHAHTQYGSSHCEQLLF